MKKKRLFVDSGKRRGTVILNWHGTPEKEFTYFAESFRLLAQESVAALRKNREFGLDGTPLEDFKAYPVVFLYRHALELYMKAILLVGSPMLELKGGATVDRERVLTIHNLDVLRQDVERVFEAFGWKWDLGSPHFQTVKDLRAVIGEFHSVDQGSYAFRYPLDTKGGASLQVAFQFNLFDFCEILDDLLETLEGAAIGAHYKLDDAMREIGEAQQAELENSTYEYEVEVYENHFDPQEEF